MRTCSANWQLYIEAWRSKSEVLRGVEPPLQEKSTKAFRKAWQSVQGAVTCETTRFPNPIPLKLLVEIISTGCDVTLAISEHEKELLVDTYGLPSWKAILSGLQGLFGSVLGLLAWQVVAAPFGFDCSSEELPSYEERRGAMFIGRLGRVSFHRFTQQVEQGPLPLKACCTHCSLLSASKQHLSLGIGATGQTGIARSGLSRRCGQQCDSGYRN